MISHIGAIKEIRANSEINSDPDKLAQAMLEIAFSREELMKITLALFEYDQTLYIGTTTTPAVKFALRIKKGVKSVDDLPNHWPQFLNLMDTHRKANEPAYSADHMTNGREKYIVMQMGDLNGIPTIDAYIPSKGAALYEELPADQIDPDQYTELMAYLKTKGISFDEVDIVGVQNSDAFHLFDAARIFGDNEFWFNAGWGIARRTEGEPAVIVLKAAQVVLDGVAYPNNKNPPMGIDPILGPLQSTDKFKANSETGLPVNHIIHKGRTQIVLSRLAEQK